MQDLHSNIEKLESNVKTLIRKLTETLHNNEELKNENNKLKREIEKFENEESVADIEMTENISQEVNSEEKYHKIKEDIHLCIAEIDECIELIEQ